MRYAIPIDWDNDGDNDVMALGRFNSKETLYYYENDGNGNFSYGLAMSVPTNNAGNNNNVDFYFEGLGGYVYFY